MAWRRSSYSQGGGSDCVEVAFAGPGVAVRDSKNTAGPILRLPEHTWRRFLASRDELTHP